MWIYAATEASALRPPQRLGQRSVAEARQDLAGQERAGAPCSVPEEKITEWSKHRKKKMSFLWANKNLKKGSQGKASTEDFLPAAQW